MFRMIELEYKLIGNSCPFDLELQECIIMQSLFQSVTF